ncbi:MAG TPA: hypothetical protein ENN73_00680, partial [Firmicutes bacterium]|nr:hypothetical protein [Bacillota bacterium]
MNLKLALPVIILFILFSCFSSASDIPLLQFLETKYEESREEYIKLKMPEYMEICERYNIDKINVENRENYFQTMFYFDLFSGKSSEPGSVSGILKTAYFSREIKPNLRNDILSIPDNKKLNKIPTVKMLPKSPVQSEILRLPSIYLEDLSSEEPKYRYKEREVFHSFGNSQEKELVFSFLLFNRDFQTQLIKSGNHYWTEV